jgi:hypothetical protein
VRLILESADLCVELRDPSFPRARVFKGRAGGIEVIAIIASIDARDPRDATLLEIGLAEPGLRVFTSAEARERPDLIEAAA